MHIAVSHASILSKDVYKEACVRGQVIGKSRTIHKTGLHHIHVSTLHYMYFAKHM